MKLYDDIELHIMGTYFSSIIEHYLNGIISVPDNTIKLTLYSGGLGKFYFDSNRTLMTVNVKSRTYFSDSNELIYIDDDSIFLDNHKLKHYTPEEFEEDYFALSTTLDQKELMFLKFSTYFCKLIESENNKVLILNFQNISTYYDFYKRIM